MVIFLYIQVLFQFNSAWVGRHTGPQCIWQYDRLFFCFCILVINDSAFLFCALCLLWPMNITDLYFFFFLVLLEFLKLVYLFFSSLFTSSLFSTVEKSYSISSLWPRADNHCSQHQEYTIISFLQRLCLFLITHHYKICYIFSLSSEMKVFWVMFEKIISCCSGLWLAEVNLFIWLSKFENSMVYGWMNE